VVAGRVSIFLLNLYSTKGGTAVYIVQYNNKRRRTSITGLQYVRGSTICIYIYDRGCIIPGPLHTPFSELTDIKEWKN